MTSDALAFPQTARTCPFSPPDAYRAKTVHQPLTRVTLWNGASAWLVSRHAEVRAVLRDPRFSKDSRRPGIPSLSAADAAINVGPNQMFVRMDDPEHARLRGIVQSHFRAPAVAELRPALEEIVRGILARMIEGKHHADIVTEYALPIPTEVICLILGVPYEDHGDFHRLTAAIVGKHADSGGYTEEGVRAAHAELNEYLDELISRKAGRPEDDVLSRLMEREQAGELTRGEAVTTAKLLLVAGHETVSNSIGLNTVLLLEHRDQLDALRADPSLWGRAVDEMLRFMTVIQRGEERVATADVEVGGVTIRSGEGVICLLSTANRDDAVFESPEQFVVRRDSRRHLAFGFGMHQCLGQFLGRLELEVGLRTLFEALPSLRLASPLQSLQFVDAHAYGLRSVPVAWDDHSVAKG